MLDERTLVRQQCSAARRAPARTFSVRRHARFSFRSAGRISALEMMQIAAVGMNPAHTYNGDGTMSRCNASQGAGAGGDISSTNAVQTRYLLRAGFACFNGRT